MEKLVDLKTHRENAGWSQSDLARYAGVDQATISRIERGGRPSGALLRMLEMWLEDHLVDPATMAAEKTKGAA